MNTKTFAGEDMRQALAAVKSELGPDALILSTKMTHRGPFRKPHLEVVAALPDNSDVANAKNHRQHAMLPATPQNFDADLASLRQEMRTLQRCLRRRKRRAAGSEPTGESCALTRSLIQSDVDPVLVHAWLNTLKKSPATTLAARKKQLIDLIASRFEVQHEFFERPYPKRIALCGPTGVGKTTTLAKIAAHAVYNHKRSVAIISLDTFRIGAVEQLQRYASLLDIVLHVAHSDNQLSEMMHRCQYADMVLLDTAGRAPADTVHQERLQQTLSQHGFDPYLVLPAAMRHAELLHMIKVFTKLAPKQLIFTKLDEAVAFGTLINAATRCNLPITFVTCGQRVPEDLAIPEEIALAKLVVCGGLKK